jgi:hypothetical protein
MDTYTWNENPAALEQTLLAELQNKNQQFLYTMNAQTNVVARLQALDYYEQSLHNYVSQANWLSNRGFPQFAQQLNFTFQDLAGARATYSQLYQNILLQQAQSNQIWMNTQAAVTRSILDATNNQIRSSRESTQDFLDAMSGTPVIHVRWR